jgi:hypothetical protein
MVFMLSASISSSVKDRQLRLFMIRLRVSFFIWSEEVFGLPVIRYDKFLRNLNMMLQVYGFVFIFKLLSSNY